MKKFPRSGPILAPPSPGTGGERLGIRPKQAALNSGAAVGRSSRLGVKAKQAEPRSWARGASAGGANTGIRFRGSLVGGRLEEALSFASLLSMRDWEEAKDSRQLALTTKSSSMHESGQGKIPWRQGPGLRIGGERSSVGRARDRNGNGGPVWRRLLYSARSGA
jgi:hypothetical protein